MKGNIDLYIYNSKKDKVAIDKFIGEYIPFIIKAISDEKKEYLNIDNDEEYSIGLLAFNEAIEKYDISKGPFLSFARLVIISRLRNHWKKENKHMHDNIDDVNTLSSELMEDNELVKEIELYKSELLKFGIDFELLIEQSPKHKDTKANAIVLSKHISESEEMISFLYLKKRLPISKISKAFNVTLKVIKRSKIFIISVVIVFHKNFKLINEWIIKKGPQN